MVRIDCLIFGYRKIKISPDDLHILTSLLIRSSIPSRINSDGTIIVRERDFSKFQKILLGRVNFDASDPLGLYGKWLCLKHKISIVLSVFIAAFILIILSSIVWDVRIEGNENITDSEIMVMLSESGIEVGSFWCKVDKSRVESVLLNNEDRIAWVNINRRGVVAYVSLIEKENTHLPDNEKNGGYCNIIATEDSVIEEISVTRGTAMVKPGDTVKAGDILIAGVISAEGGAFCHAEGKIIGRINETICVEVSRGYEKKTEIGNKPYSCDLKIFNFSLNIFKRYRNLTKECDIIDHEKAYSLLGRYRLPFSLNLKYIPEYTVEMAEYSDEEIVFVAQERLNSLTVSRLVNSDLVSIRTYGNFIEEGYSMRSDIIYHKDIGQKSYFDVR